MGPVRGPRSASTSRRLRVAGRSVPARPVAACVCATFVSEVSRPTRVCRSLAMPFIGYRLPGPVGPGYRICAYVARNSWRSASRRPCLRSAFFSDGSFCGLQSRQPARRCLGRLRLWWAMTSSYQQTPAPQARPRVVPIATLNPAEMRMRGLEPPRTYIHTDLNRARLPIPPHPRDGWATISHAWAFGSARAAAARLWALLASGLLVLAAIV